MGAFSLLGILGGDRIPIADGFGWDGQLYAQVAANPYLTLWVRGISSYHWGKVLPSLVVHAGMLVSGAIITPPAVVKGFLLLNSAMLLLGTAIYNRLATFLRLSVAARWLGFCFLFINVNAIKVGFYYSVLTDISALVLGLAMTYFYLSRQTTALALTTLVSSFTWGTALMMGLALLLFPAPADSRFEEPGLTPTPSLIPRGLAGLIALGAAGRLYYLYKVESLRAIGYGPIPLTVEPVYPISLLCTTLYIYAVFAWFFSLLSPGNVGAALRRLDWRHVGLAVAVALPVKLIGALLAKGVYPFTVAAHFQMVTFQSATRPGVWMVAHFLAFGPMVAFLPLAWKGMRDMLALWGPGAVLFTVLNLMTLIAPESRHSVFGYPFLAIVMVLVLDRAKLVSNNLAWGVGLLSLVMCRVWQRFDTGAVDADGAPDVSRYFATQGMQLPNADYLLGLIVLVLLGTGLLAYARSSRARNVVDPMEPPQVQGQP